MPALSSSMPPARLCRLLVVAAVTLLIAGCGSSTSTSGVASAPVPAATLVAPATSAIRSARPDTVSPSPSGPSGGSIPAPAAAPHLRLVAIGDSIARASSCPGCTDFVDLYARAVSAALGRPVDVDNRAATELSALPPVEASALLNDLLVDDSLREAIAQADIVLISVGFNDTPWNRFDNPCGASNPEATVVRWDLISDACVHQTASEYAQVLDQILTQVDELRGCAVPPGEPAAFCRLAHRNSTLLRLVTVYDDWIGEPGSPPRSRNDPTQRADAAFVHAQCWVIEEHGGACADAYHALNGADGSADAARFLADDHTHLSQHGHDLIAAILTHLGYASLQ